MKNYSLKYKIKISIFSIALLLITGVVILLNSTINNIKKEERKQVMLWAEAVQKRYSLMEYTNRLFEKLKDEERRKIELWSEAQHHILDEENSEFLTFLLKIISSNKTIPIILTDTKGLVVSSINLENQLENNKPIPDTLIKEYTKHKPIPVMYENIPINYLYYTDSKLFKELQNVMNDMITSFVEEVVKNSASVPVIITNQDTTKIIAFGNIDSVRLSKNNDLFPILYEMASSNQAIPITLNNSVVSYIFYEDSLLITRLTYYPYILILFSIVLLLFAYFAFRSSEKYEQNQLLVGMSKETAHQLGTPISSLMAWVELLRMKDIEAEVIEEINKDVIRLNTVAERFSKIGSAPMLSLQNLNEVVINSMKYITMRTSDKIHFDIHSSQRDLIIPINISLFEWVIENITKNAIDAMQGDGKLTVTISHSNSTAFIDIEDTGKGIPKNKFKTIFKPGYSTKQRGWGLGLSLAKRIIEEYHKGKIIVKSSEIGKGTIFRIILPLS